jgi:hypothetical protein
VDTEAPHIILPSASVVYTNGTIQYCAVVDADDHDSDNDAVGSVNVTIVDFYGDELSVLQEWNSSCMVLNFGALLDGEYQPVITVSVC